MTIDERVAADKGYAWRYSQGEGPAPVPVYLRMLALAGDADRIIASNVSSSLEPKGSTWSVTWLLPTAIAHVCMVREGDPAWSGSSKVEAEGTQDRVDAAWLYPLSSVVGLEISGLRVWTLPYEDEPYWNAEAMVHIEGGKKLHLAGVSEAGGGRVRYLGLPPVASHLRRWLIDGVLPAEL